MSDVDIRLRTESLRKTVECAGKKIEYEGHKCLSCGAVLYQVKKKEKVHGN